MANLVEFQEFGVDHAVRNLNGSRAFRQEAPFYGSLPVGKPSNIAGHLKLDQDRAVFHEQAKRDVFTHRAVNLGLGAGNDAFNKVASLPGAAGLKQARGVKFKYNG